MLSLKKVLKDALPMELSDLVKHNLSKVCGHHKNQTMSTSGQLLKGEILVKKATMDATQANHVRIMAPVLRKELSLSVHVLMDGKECTVQVERSLASTTTLVLSSQHVESLIIQLFVIALWEKLATLVPLVSRTDQNFILIPKIGVASFEERQTLSLFLCRLQCLYL
jgi:hypothetical protein